MSKPRREEINMTETEASIRGILFDSVLDTDTIVSLCFKTKHGSKENLVAEIVLGGRHGFLDTLISVAPLSDSE